MNEKASVALIQDCSAGSILSPLFSFYKFRIIQGVYKVQRVLLGPNQCHFVLTVHNAPIAFHNSSLHAANTNHICVSGGKMEQDVGMV